MKIRSFIISLLPFWLFVLFFKFGAGLHYSLLSALGSQVLPLWLVGLCVGGGAFLQLVFDVPAGYLLDRFGYVRLLRLATFIFALGALALLFGLTSVTFVITVLLATFGWLFFGPGANAYMLSQSPKEAAGRYLGFYHAVAAAGIVLASVLLTMIINWPPAIIGVVLGVLLLVAFLAAWLMPKETTSVHAEKKVVRHAYYIRRHLLVHLFRLISKLNPASTLLLLQSFVGCLFYGVIWFAVPLVLARGEQSELLGVSLGVFDLAVVLLGSFFGQLADRYSQKRLVFVGLLIFAVAGTLIGFNLNVWFLLLGFLATAGDEMSSVSLWAWLDRLDSKHNEDGLISGAIVFFEDLGWMLGPILAGLLYGLVGPAWTITLAAVPIFILWILSLIFIGKMAPVTGRCTLEVPRRLRHKR